MIIVRGGRRGAAGGYSSPAQDYISRVIAADVAAGDSSGLETATQNAYAAFIDGLITDGLLGVSAGVIDQASSILKASCILAGARTLAGCLVPLVGPAPTNNGFTSGDYNRKTGLKNPSNKYLVTNRLLNADPQNDIHVSAFKNDAISASNPYYIGGYNSGLSIITAVGLNAIYVNSAQAGGIASSGIGLHGASRSSSSSILAKRPGAAVASFGSVSSGTLALSPFVFNLNAAGSPGTQFSTSSLTWYSQGLSLNLTSLDGRVSTLMAALSAAIA